MRDGISMENKPGIFKIIMAVLFIVGGVFIFFAMIFFQNILRGTGFLFMSTGISILLLNGKNNTGKTRSPRVYRPGEVQKASPIRPAYKSEDHTEVQADAYLRALNFANDLIPGDEISGDIEDVQHLTYEIFKYAQDAQNEAALNRFFSYYLPTLLKLLQTYIELDKKTVQTRQIVETKDKIAESIKNIKCAFTMLYDNFTSATTLNVESEIEALMTVMSLDGLHDSLSLSETQKEKICNK